MMAFLNGKKTVIGAAILLTSAFARWAAEGDAPDWSLVAEAFGVIITAIGLGHKGVKTVLWQGV